LEGGGRRVVLLFFDFLIVLLSSDIIRGLINEKAMKSYEITYLINPDFTEDEALKYHEKFKKSLEKNSAVLGSEQNPTKKLLAYPVNGSIEGYLASSDFEVDAQTVKDIEKIAEKESDILRHIIIEKKSTKKTEEREERKRKKKSLKPEKTKLKEIDDKIDEIV
jgi:ribosomal protein S6